MPDHYHSILKHIEQQVTLSEQEKKAFCSKLIYKKFRRKQYLLQDGDICSHDYFVINGCLRQYEVSPSGRENTVQFAFENWWISDWYSMLHTQPSVYNIEAMENSEVFMLEKNELEGLYIEIPKLERYFRKIFLNAFVSLQKRILFQQKTAEERYQEFVKEYGWFEQRLSQQHIASFLGITRETLNRLKSQQHKDI
ncbi:Crp/Fnr family transcriptional regulator [Chryseobacterium rhizoplanae]|uniref:Crp/Fnr family transcriptional regulator n=1 Tax=Chryseobacterium rhizoplanae TaxID=1609531 RepID=UPI001CE37435|nr:Crp/Fnr family transcriptional regulator [Chryseobacterium rhizoplanae]UCA61356.1 Crp/Fnr family transcriptional regulator [Chryseobacterium rhizoplanae]